METLQTLQAKHEKEIVSLNTKMELQYKFLSLTGLTPSIISPDRNPFAVFYPDTRDQYLTIINNIEPTTKAKVEFSGKDAIQTFSPYLVTYGGEHNTPNYMEACVKFNSSICPIWIKMPGEVLKDKFNVSTFDGKHIGFGNYERKYTLQAKEGRTTVQEYYGKNRTMYAANEQEGDKLFDFITL